jgi:hypothetical protein
VATAAKTEQVPWYARRRLFWLGAAAAVLFLGGAALWSYYFDAQQKERLRQEVRMQIPVGSNRHHVEQWAQQQLGRNVLLQECAEGRLPVKKFPDAAGVPQAEQQWYFMLTIPMGQPLINGYLPSNPMWVFLPLNSSGEVTGHYFLTLDELAEMEANDRNKAK